MDYILYGVNYQTLIMMMSDAPRYVAGRKRGGGCSRATAEEEASGIADYFRSNLKA